MPQYDKRSPGEEMMDDPDVASASLQAALAELPRINRWLGGYRATLTILDEYYLSRRPANLTILDVATGAGDYPAHMVKWGLRRGIDIRVTALDLSPETIAFAKRAAESRLPVDVSDRIEFVVGNALDLHPVEHSCDICTSALFFHHLARDTCVRVLGRMLSVADQGVIVNDIHRHPLAYHGIRAVTRALPFSEMVRHDGPLSVLRAFTREELEQISREAGLDDVRVSWHWAFRWTLTNLPR